MFELFKNSGWIAWPLGLCSVLALGILLERLFTLARLKRLEDRAFMILQLAIEKGDDGMLRDPKIAAAPITQVMTHLVGLRGASEESLAQAAELSLALQRLRLRRYLGTLATIGSITPFIGLFGTVLGVMQAFQAMGQQGGLNGEVMATGIYLALSTTALGLLIAVPTVIAYNYFVGRVYVMLLHIQGHVARLAPLLRAPERERQEA
jgi:biopolymer transport protein ExbB